MTATDPIIEYENTLTLVYDAQAFTLKGLRSNPDKQQERSLNKRLAKLKVEEADLIAMIDAIEDDPSEELPMPDEALLNEIIRLTGEVEKATGKNVTASGALKITGEILDLAVKLTGE